MKTNEGKNARRVKRSAALTKEDAEHLKMSVLTEAQRYYDNAKNMLSEKGGKNDDYYTDAKYVKTACGTAYCGVLLVLDGFIRLKGNVLPRQGRKNIDYYLANIGHRDRKLLDYVQTAYHILHLTGYYDGELNCRIIQTGMEQFEKIIRHFDLRC